MKEILSSRPVMVIRFLITVCVVLLAIGNVGIGPAAALPAASVAEVSSGGQPLFHFSGTRPSNLGVKDGKLAPCPTSPNCVSSQADPSDAEHAIAPLSYSSTPGEAIAALKGIIQGLERTEIIEESDTYLYAEFTSALMGFVDDVEFYAEPGSGTIHVRSASRLGQSDLGVNRSRIETIRSQWAAQVGA
jgi:uncharacterized protein (DUF1499 family)